MGRRAAYIIRKASLTVTGDGHRSLGDILADPTTPLPLFANRSAILADITLSNPGLDLSEVLPAGQVWRSWKYNESKGAAFVAVHDWTGDSRLEEAVRVDAGRSVRSGTPLWRGGYPRPDLRCTRGQH